MILNLTTRMGWDRIINDPTCEGKRRHIAMMWVRFPP